MNIGIDANEANISHRVGVGQYAYNLLLEIYRQDSSNNYHLYLKAPPLSDFPPENDHWHYHIFGPTKLWTKFALPLRLLFNPHHLKLFYSPSHYSPFLPFIPTIPTIHDIGYLQFQDQFTKKDLYQLIHWTKDSLDRAAHIVAVSQFTKNELYRVYQLPLAKISVVYNGVSKPPVISNDISRQVFSKFNITKPYFLSVGTLKPNKNYPFLLNAFSDFLKKHPDYQLVIAGKKGWLFDEISLTVESLKLQNKVIFTDYISETEKWALYQQATALVIPSTYEGFGIPAIESQIVGTPVIASDIPSLKEVLADSAIFINPHQVKSLSQALEDILSKSLRQKLIDKGYQQCQIFSWKKSAQALISLFTQKFDTKTV